MPTYPTKTQAAAMLERGGGRPLPTEQQIRGLMARAETAGDRFTVASCRCTLAGDPTHLLAVALCAVTVNP